MKKERKKKNQLDQFYTVSEDFCLRSFTYFFSSLSRALFFYRLAILFVSNGCPSDLSSPALSRLCKYSNTHSIGVQNSWKWILYYCMELQTMPIHAFPLPYLTFPFLPTLMRDDRIKRRKQRLCQTTKSKCRVTREKDEIEPSKCKKKG